MAEETRDTRHHLGLAKGPLPFPKSCYSLYSAAQNKFFKSAAFRIFSLAIWSCIVQDSDGLPYWPSMVFRSRLAVARPGQLTRSSQEAEVHTRLPDDNLMVRRFIAATCPLYTSTSSNPSSPYPISYSLSFTKWPQQQRPQSPLYPALYLPRSSPRSL